MGKKEISYPVRGNDIYFELEDKSFWFCHRNDCIVELMKGFPPRGIVYDVGGGNGCVAKALEDHGLQTVLVEPGESGIANAKKRGLKNMICSRLEELELPPYSLPAIGLFDVIEHIENPTEFLRTISLLLVPGGMLYITVPAFHFLWSEDDDMAGHFQRYSLKSIRNLLEENGFCVQYGTYIFSILPFPIFLFRSLPSKFKSNNRRNRSTIEKRKKDQVRFHKQWNKNKFFENFFSLERSLVRSQIKIPLGSSCLIAAKAK